MSWHKPGSTFLFEPTRREKAFPRGYSFMDSTLTSMVPVLFGYTVIFLGKRKLELIPGDDYYDLFVVNVGQSISLTLLSSQREGWRFREIR